ncbi:hypothetical protein D9757_003766 [Collybiopsis confluens]|uniref:Uncharacterized protein n=1 Tax=Collybiopsis confluens TaxID=2823264 RepID=A0A8H5MDY1_9AGAR|nr:hypothetical protein D9757_003766 [Collybiopsis confluens]
MDIFTWSLPFVGEQINDMLVAVLITCTKEELEEEGGDEEIGLWAIKNKILAVGRVARVFSLLRKESENVSELGSVCFSGQLPHGIRTLASETEGVKNAIKGFEDACVVIFLSENHENANLAVYSKEGKALIASANGVAAGLEAALLSGSIPLKFFIFVTQHIVIDLFPKQANDPDYAR